jgi:phosphonate transport system substrate-binding protein
MNEPLRNYLERQLGITVELVVGKSYASTGEDLRRGNLDIAYLGPVTFVLQSRYAELEPFARPTHAGNIGPTFKAVIIAPSDSTTKTLAELKGKEIALGDLASTSGSWVPRHMLLEAGLIADRDYRRSHMGTHDAVAKAVANHKVAAGGLSLGIYTRLLEEKILAPEATRVIAESRPIPEYMWTFRAGLEPILREEIRQAFIRLRAPEALRAYRAESFIPSVDADVDRVRYWMEDILQSTLDDHKGSAEHIFLRKSANQLTQPQSFHSISTC